MGDLTRVEEEVKLTVGPVILVLSDFFIPCSYATNYEMIGKSSFFSVELCSLSLIIAFPLSDY